MSHDHKITALVSIQVSLYDNANVDTGMFEQDSSRIIQILLV